MAVQTRVPAPPPITPAVTAPSVDRLDRAALAPLLAPRPWPCVTLYLPTHRYGKGIRQNAARFRALVQVAEVRLGELDLDPSAAEGILEPARVLLEDRAFWAFQAEGLVLFAAPGLFVRHRLPIPFAERVVVGERFYLKPLVPMLDGGGRFYVLALSVNRVRLLEADRWAVRHLELGPVPASMEAALGYAEYYSGLGMHSASPKGLHGQPGVVFHGHGDADEDRLEQDLRHYFQRIARALDERLPDREAPIVLAAVAEHVSLYRQVAGDPRVLEAAVKGNPELLSDDVLRLAAWPLAEPRLTEARRGALARYVDLGGTGRAATGVDAVVVAADRGRVESLFVRPDAESWGTFERDLGRVEVHGTREAGDDDLVDLAVTRTLETSGEVFALAPGDLEGAEIAAVLRY